MAWLGNGVILLTVAGILGWGMLRGVAVFDVFLEGAREGLQTALGIFPALTALTLCVTMLRASGAPETIAALLSPVIGAVNIPPETVPLMLLRPISGSGALSVIRRIFEDVGPDSFAGRVASVMIGSTETTFYAVTVYFGSVGVKKTGYVIPAALTADLAGMLFAALTVTLFFY